jgi:hypothetical protein
MEEAVAHRLKVGFYRFERHVPRITGMHAHLRLGEIDAAFRKHALEADQHVEVVALSVDLQKADTIDPVLG